MPDLRSLQQKYVPFTKALRELVAVRNGGLDTTLVQRLAQELHDASLMYDPGIKYSDGKKHEFEDEESFTVANISVNRPRSTGDVTQDRVSHYCQCAFKIVTPLCTPYGQVSDDANGRLLHIAEEIERVIGIKVDQAEIQITENVTPSVHSEAQPDANEQAVIDWLYAQGATSLKSLAKVRLKTTADVVVDGALKLQAGGGCGRAILSNMRKHGWIDNARHHGGIAGYFLTPSGSSFAKKPDQQASPDLVRT